MTTATKDPLSETASGFDGENDLETLRVMASCIAEELSTISSTRMALEMIMAENNSNAGDLSDFGIMLDLDILLTQIADLEENMAGIDRRIATLEAQSQPREEYKISKADEAAIINLTRIDSARISQIDIDMEFTRKLRELEGAGRNVEACVAETVLTELEISKIRVRKVFFAGQNEVPKCTMFVPLSISTRKMPKRRSSGLRASVRFS